MIHKVISDGQSSLYRGASEQISAINCNVSARAPGGIRLGKMNIGERISLDGTWQFHLGDLGDHITEMSNWRPVPVPAPWQAATPELSETMGIGWYRRTFQIPPHWAGRRVILHFGAVDYHAQVWVNGVRVGDHEGGYLPFELAIEEAVHFDGENEILVRVVDPTQNEVAFPRFPFAEIPHGKQSWYGPVGGLWQSVRLEARAACHIAQLHVTPLPQQEQAQISVWLSSQPPLGTRLRLDILDPDGEVVASDVLPAEAATITGTLTVPRPLLWSPDQPHLYIVRATLIQADGVTDAIQERFGWRALEARDGRLYLNGELLYLRGALDQDYYPHTIYTPPSLAFLEEQFRKAKEMGLNALRCHIKIPDPRYYEAADRVGLLIWTDLPNWWLLTEAAKARARQTLAGIVARDWNHPSLIAWSIANESWGLDLVHNSEHRAWLKEMYTYLKQLDPYRLVIDNSPCWPNFHLQSDVEDYHHYTCIPDHYREWERWTAEFARRSEWSYSPHGDAVRSGQEPLVVSEFGNWGLPDAEKLRDVDGNEPWWFETGLEWGPEPAVYPHGVQRRFRLWSLDRVFGSWEAFIAATQWQQYQALKYQIEVMRRHPSIAGYVITELTDVFWECNGLLDMHRRPKAYQELLTRINADDVIIPRWQRLAYWGGETCQVDLFVSHYSTAALEGSRLRWELEGTSLTEELPVGHCERGRVVHVGALQCCLPDSDTATQRALRMQLLAHDGRVLAQNDLTLTVYPSRWREADSELPTLSVYGEPLLAETLAEMGYTLADDAPSGNVVVATRLDEHIRDYVQAGGRALLLLDAADAITAPLERLGVAARQGRAWQGDWASSFAWLRRDGAYAVLPGGPLLDFAFADIIPDHVLTGFAPMEFEADVAAGLFVGWIHQTVALIGRKRYGRGEVLVTTFKLNPSTLTTQPTAAVLLRALLRSLTETRLTTP